MSSAGYEGPKTWYASRELSTYWYVGACNHLRLVCVRRGWARRGAKISITETAERAMSAELDVKGRYTGERSAPRLRYAAENPTYQPIPPTGSKARLTRTLERIRGRARGKELIIFWARL